MIRNSLLIFIRNLKRQKLFSTINLLGLTVSITSTLLILLYVSHELSYDKFHPNADRIYRVNQTFIWGDNNDSQFSRTGPGVAHAIKEEIPEVELVTSLHTPGDFLVSYTAPGNEVVSFEETKVLAADTNFFKVLGFPLLKGDANSAFRNENTLMLTESTARRYFGDKEPIGQFLILGVGKDHSTTYEVTGVIGDVPRNSTIQFDILLSSKNFNVERMHWSWIWTQLETFVLFSEGADMANIQSRLATIPQKRAEYTLREVMKISFEEYIASGKKWDLFLQPISSMHLPEHPVIGSFTDIGNIRIIYSLIGAAIFIVILSCINFMNLSTAQFTRRVKETGVRKILGMGKAELGAGYLFEALIFCFLALIGALAITQALLPGFNMLTTKQLSMITLWKPQVFAGLIALVICMAVASSVYPAMSLSAFKPTEAMKGKIKTGKKGATFRNGLVVFQFAISIILIICTGIVFQQLNYVNGKDLGFDKENVMRIRNVEAVKNPDVLVKAIADIPGVVNASACSSTPPELYGGDNFTAEGNNDRTFALNFTTADEHFIPTLSIKLKTGRNFSEDIPSDVNGVILNESAVRQIGWTVDESVLGKRIRYPVSERAVFEVIGVVSDFNYWSLDSEIEPMAIFHLKNADIYDGNRLFTVIKIASASVSDWERVSAKITETWKQHAGDAPFDFGFIDQYFADAFKTQQRFGYVLLMVASLAILIASLGLLGMIIYSLEQRTKEIGIRKVSGATSWNILTLISGAYIRLILVGFVLGAPISYLMMNEWLEEFAYRVAPSPWIFISACLCILVIAMSITSYHSLRAAKANPVDVLRDE